MSLVCLCTFYLCKIVLHSLLTTVNELCCGILQQTVVKLHKHNKWVKQPLLLVLKLISHITIINLTLLFCYMADIDDGITAKVAGLQEEELNMNMGGSEFGDNDSDFTSGLDEVDQLEYEDEREDEEETVEVESGKRKLKAAVWSTAAKKVDNKACCNVCNQFFSCKDGSTSNITSHIKSKHAGSDECKAMLMLQEERRQKMMKKPKLQPPSILDFFSAKKHLTGKESNKMKNSVMDQFATNTTVCYSIDSILQHGMTVEELSVTEDWKRYKTQAQERRKIGLRRTKSSIIRQVSCSFTFMFLFYLPVLSKSLLQSSLSSWSHFSSPLIPRSAATSSQLSTLCSCTVQTPSYTNCSTACIWSVLTPLR